MMPKVSKYEWTMQTTHGRVSVSRLPQHILTLRYEGHLKNKQRSTHATLVLLSDGTFKVSPPRLRSQIVDTLFHALALLAQRGVTVPNADMITEVLATQSGRPQGGA